MALIDLEKKVGIVLEKRNLPKPPPTRVGLVIDGSGSMTKLYHRGVVQSAVDRLLAVASKFDDDGNLDAWMFNHQSHPLPQATAGDYANYVKSKILSRYPIDGGTHLEPVMRDVTEFYFPEEIAPKPATPAKAPGFWSRLFGSGSSPQLQPDAPHAGAAKRSAGIPAYVLVITDGENSDPRATERLLARGAGDGIPIFWQMVGIGDENFRFLRTAADFNANVGFCAIPDLAKTSDEALFERILSEKFINWIRQ